MMDAYRNSVRYHAKNKLDSIIFNECEEHTDSFFETLTNMPVKHIYFYDRSIETIFNKCERMSCYLSNFLAIGGKMTFILNEAPNTDVIGSYIDVSYTSSIKIITTEKKVSRTKETGEKVEMRFCFCGENIYRAEFVSDTAICNYNDPVNVYFLRSLYMKLYYKY